MMDTISVDAAQHIRWDWLVAATLFVCGMFGLVAWLVVRSTGKTRNSTPCMFEYASVEVLQEPTRDSSPPPCVVVRLGNFDDEYRVVGADNIRRSAQKLRDVANEMECAADTMTRYSYFAWISGG